MENFKEFLNRPETLILEMPHILLDKGRKVVDLELEVHSSMKPIEFINYIKDWVSGKAIQSKNPELTMKLTSDVLKEFIEKILKDSYFKNFTIKYYGKEIWEKLESFCLSVLKTN